MPAILDDPARPLIYRASGAPPYPGPDEPLPLPIVPRQVTLRDRITVATLVPFSSPAQVPPLLLAYLCDQLNREIEKGDTYPMDEPLTVEQFRLYWFGNFGAVMVVGELDQVQDLRGEKDWSESCLGSFYVKPNYPGRSSHVCNGGFLVTDAKRNRGVGRLMGECYLEWAPLLVRIGHFYHPICHVAVADAAAPLLARHFESAPPIIVRDGALTLDWRRATRIRSLIWYMKRMWRHVGYGMRWASSVLGASRAAAS
jgi:hypothetical protein